MWDGQTLPSIIDQADSDAVGVTGREAFTDRCDKQCRHRSAEAWPIALEEGCSNLIRLDGRKFCCHDTAQCAEGCRQVLEEGKGPSSRDSAPD